MSETTNDLIDRAEALGLRADVLMAARRYCGLCDLWVPARQTVCRACGADTDRPMKGGSRENV